MKHSQINNILRLHGLKIFKKAMKTGLPIIYEEHNCIIRLYQGKKTIIKKIGKTKHNLSKKFILK